MTTVASQPTAVPGALQRNLRAVSMRSPHVSQAITEAPEPLDLELFESDERGAITGSLANRALASHRRPITEAKRLAETIDPKAAGAVVILGFGLGHHIEAIASRCAGECILVVFEPDVSLLRAVLSRIDHSDWLGRGNVVIATNPADAATLTSSLREQQGLMTMGVRIAEHLPSRQRLGDSAAQFCETFSRVLAAARTTIVTTLVQSETTVRNFLGNARAYVEHPGVTDLAKCAAGFPAITVAAGPSLAHNIELLKTPGLREHCVIIAAQTVLKPLLAKGIKPHFVTSLDFHEISARFYEGLTPEQVADTTLIVEPKANPAIIRAFPGPKRLPAEQTLDVLLGEELAGDHGAIRAGSTVAHLSYFVARLLGCDPVIMIGQDLGFTDGLYYANGAAIHSVWSGELNTFRSLEMMEWERIVRHRQQLRKVTSVDGNEIYTDEQMATYLAEFDRVILEDSRTGRTTIDATEGGAAKANAETMTLADAIAAHVSFDSKPLPNFAAPTVADSDAAQRWNKASQRIESIRKDVVRLAKLSRDSDRLLEQMIDHVDDPAAVNRLIRKTHKLRDEAMSMTTAFALVQRLNQMGAFKRVRADREITLTDDLSPQETQRRRIERDRVNVKWIAESSDSLVRLIDSASADSESPKKHLHKQNSSVTVTKAISPQSAKKLVGAIVVFDPERSALGVPRDGARDIAGRPALAWTLARLAQCKRLNRAVIVTTDESAAQAIIAAHPVDLNTDVVTVEERTLRRPGIAAARLFSRTTWRGGIANITCHDENFLPEAIHEVMCARDWRAALLGGADWSLVDPQLCDDAIDRWTEATGNLLAFSQAPPGLCGCVIDRTLLDQWRGSKNLGVLGAIGGMLGYHPRRPTPDPIAQRACAAIDPRIRDAHARFIVDDHRAAALIEEFSEDALTWSALEVINRANAAAPCSPHHYVIELCAGRPKHGVVAPWATGVSEDWKTTPRERIESILQAIGAARNDAIVTFTGVGDPLTHPDIIDLISFAKQCGVAGAHVRTPLHTDRTMLDALLKSPLDVLSVDLFANTAATYEKLTGVEGFRAALENIDRLIQSRAGTPPDAMPWIVPHITRCESTIDEIEGFYDKWLIVLGAAVIDPLPQGTITGRISALDLPTGAAQLRQRTTMDVPMDADLNDIAANAGWL